ncbi:hypothetical protein QM012_001565 [Aureobasidium pullulans]|uniref:C2H2-type domain-containing protein n=1 Tax=Aureobasidium pullulans TaxID=5580 RepID=A0ABR0TFT0_AURPU
MASNEDVLIHVLWLICSLLTLTPSALKNPVFAMVLSTQEYIEQLLVDSLVCFCPGLLEILHQSSSPPSLSFFKSIPCLLDLRVWAIYIVVLEKARSWFRIYVGSATDKKNGAKTRFKHYDDLDRLKLPRYVLHALDNGYTITHKGLICWAPIPRPSARYALRCLFLAMEATFAVVFWAMKSRTKDYGLPHLCPWDTYENIPYDGCCSHSALTESPRGQTDGLTPEQIDELEAALLAKQAAAMKARYDGAKASDPVAFKATRAQYAEVAKQQRLQNKLTGRFACDTCGSTFRTQVELDIHNGCPKHIHAINGTTPVIVLKDPKHKSWTESNKAQRRFECRLCGINPSSAYKLEYHQGLPKHINKASDYLLQVLEDCHFDEWDNAALAMMERAADAWEHHSFKDTIVKVANLEIYYKALNFYLQEQPSLLTDLLQALTPRIDVNRVVRMFEKSDNIPLIKPFLLNVQSQNKRAVNDAINDLLIEEEDYKTLRDSVENYDNYEAVALAQRLEKHDLVFFRQIAANIYRKTKRWDKSIALSKQDKLFKDAIETAAMSGKAEVVEELLRYFVDIGSRECFVGMLYACYDLIPLHVVMELSWRHGLNDFTMPFMINYMSQQAMAIEQLKKDNEERKSKEVTQKTEADNTPILGGSRLMLTQGPAASAPSPVPYSNGVMAQPTGFQPTGFGGFR